MNKYIRLIIGVIVVLASGQLSLLSAHAQDLTLPRLEQLTKSNIVGETLDYREYPSQTVSCADVPGNLKSVTFSLGAKYYNNAIWTHAYVKGVNAYNSTSLVVAPGQADYTFTFDQEIDVKNDLCAGSDSFTIELRASSGPSSPLDIYGSASDTYAGGVGGVSYDGSAHGWSYDNFSPSSNGSDAYFILNGTAEVNHAPVLPVNTAEYVIDEGALLNVALPVASDIDQFTSVRPAAIVSSAPTGIILVGGSLNWTPQFEQAGVYEFDVRYDDDGNQSLFEKKSTLLHVRISVANNIPLFSHLEQLTKSSIVSESVDYRDYVSQTFSCSDVPGDLKSVTFSLGGKYYNSSIWARAYVKGLNEYNSNTLYVGPGQSDYSFTFDQAIDIKNDLCAGKSSFVIELKAGSGSSAPLEIYGSAVDAYASGTAGVATDSGNPGTGVYFTPSANGSDTYFIINGTVEVNHAPVFTTISNQTTSEGVPLSVVVSTNDSDGDITTLTVAGLPSGAIFDANAATLKWTPTYTQAGEYDVVFTATDNGTPQLVASSTVHISVTNVNRAPVLDPIGNKTVNEGSVLNFTLHAADPDGDALTYSAQNLPAGATFVASTGTFSWTPGYDQAGEYKDIEFTVTDSGTPLQLAMETITIAVGNVNRSPIFADPGSYTVLEANPLRFGVSATDPDHNAVTLSASDMPSGSMFDASTGTFSWTPIRGQAGVYTVHFIATDNDSSPSSSSIDVVVTVGANPTPSEEAGQLVDVVVTSPIPQQSENAYLANLKKVEKFIEQGKTQPAINQLNAFVDKVQGDIQRGVITSAVGNGFITRAKKIISDIS